MTISNKRRFIQYNLWKNCNNNCDFCFNRGCKFASDNEKLEILAFTIDKMCSKEMNSYNEVGFIGGEFFDNQLDNDDIREKFYQLFQICKQKIQNNFLDKICVATSLIYNIEKSLVPFIEFLKQLGIEQHILFCTSYDTKYRFHTYNDEILWKSNMKKVKTMLSNKIHTEMIMTQFLINDVMSGKFNLTEFSRQFDTSIDFIEPTFIDFFQSREHSIKELPDFFPKRSSFLNFIQVVALQERVIDIDRFLSIKLRSDTSYYKLESGEWVKIDDRWRKGIRRIDHYGNFKQIFSYSDSDASMIDDVLTIMGKDCDNRIEK